MSASMRCVWCCGRLRAKAPICKRFPQECCQRCSSTGAPLLKVALNPAPSAFFLSATIWRLAASSPLQPHYCRCTLTQAGLSALKTPLSLADSCCREDPLHLPAFRQLAEGLPYARHVHSKLICAITRELMDEHNPPAALPNGWAARMRRVSTPLCLPSLCLCPPARLMVPSRAWALLATRW